MYAIRFTKLAEKHKKMIKQAGLEKNVKRLLSIISEDPYKNPPPYEMLVGDLKGLCSRRINIQHRLVYQVYEKEKVVKIIAMWTHYQDL